MKDQYALRSVALFAAIAFVTREGEKNGEDAFDERHEQVTGRIQKYIDDKEGELSERAVFVELSETTSKPEEKAKGTLSAKLMAKIPTGEFTVNDLDTNTIFKALSAGIIKVVSEIKLAGRGRPSKVYAMA